MSMQACSKLPEQHALILQNQLTLSRSSETITEGERDFPHCSHRPGVSDSYQRVGVLYLHPSAQDHFVNHSKRL